MRLAHAISASLLFALAACGEAAAPTEADAQTASATHGAEITSAERTAILAASNMQANAQGLIENECGEAVTPQFLLADLGPGPGRVIAFIMVGGPNTISCYGDGPLVTLMRENNGAWAEIYSNRGGPAIVLTAQHNNGNDLADGGPGFTFPVWQWDGSTYSNANRTVADSALGDARYIPN